MSDTPRTDEAVDYASNFHPDCEVVNVEVAIDLERELAEAREQRDTLVDAAQAVVDRWDAPTWKELEPTAKLISALRKAIATVKGGSDD